MKISRINYAEFSVFKEIPIIIKIRLKQIITSQSVNSQKNSKILIVNTGLIGDFLATLPAINEFLKKEKLRADIIVSPPLKTLAKHIRGIDKVFVAKSSYIREIEKNNITKNIPAKEYDTLLVLRTSRDAYDLIKKIRYSKLMHNDKAFIKWIGYILLHAPIKKVEKQWREVNYDIVQIKNQKILQFNQIFNFNKKDYKSIKKYPELNSRSKKIIIHTGSGWNAKLWNNNKWIEVLESINSIEKYQFIFVGSGNIEMESFNYIQSKIDFKIYSLINKIDLKELLLIMKQSNYFIGVDSGPRNLAHIANLRSIVLMGPAALRDFKPTNHEDIVIDKLKGIPTHFFYLGPNPIDKIMPKEVFDAFNKLSNKKSQSKTDHHQS